MVDPSLDLGKDGRNQQNRLGNNIIKMKDVTLSFGEGKDKMMLDNFSYNFNRYAISGANE